MEIYIFQGRTLKTLLTFLQPQQRLLILVLYVECCVDLKLASKVIEGTNASRASSAEYAVEPSYAENDEKVNYIWEEIKTKIG